MFGWVKGMMRNKALDILKEKYMKELLEGIGQVKELQYKDKKFHLTLVLNGIEQPINISCSNIEFGPEGRSVTVHEFDSDMPFIKVALNRFATRTFDVPDGAARLAVESTRKILDI